MKTSTFLLVAAMVGLSAGACHAQATASETLAVSREVSYYELPVAPDAPMLTMAVSREVSAYIGYSMQNAALVLRIAGGLHMPTALEFQLLNLQDGQPSVIDVLDAVAVAKRAYNP